MQDAVKFLDERNRDDAFFTIATEKLSLLQVSLFVDSIVIVEVEPNELWLPYNALFLLTLLYTLKEDRQRFYRKWVENSFEQCITTQTRVGSTNG